jgi:hypothetical protein
MSLSHKISIPILLEIKSKDIVLEENLELTWYLCIAKNCTIVLE